MEMMEFVPKLIESYEKWPDIPIGSSGTMTVPAAAKVLRDATLFDCTEISQHAMDTAIIEYEDFETPPSADTILPASPLALYVDMSHVGKNPHVDPTQIVAQEKLILLMVPTASKSQHPDFEFGVENPLDVTEFPWELPLENFFVAGCYLSDTMAPRIVGAVSTKYVGGMKIKEFQREKWTGENSNVTQLQIDATWLRCAAHFLHLINKPRFVKSQPIGTRQQRRGLHRGMGFAVDAWHKISWNIDKPVAAKVPYDETFHKKPLHFRRGHWRKALANHPKSIQRQDGKWYTWIEGFWAGHPAFGTKKAYYQPKAGAA